MEHAETMLVTAEQLVAGFGASMVKGGGEKVKSGSKGDHVGNAHLRLWIGERSLGERRLFFFVFALSIFRILT